MKEPMAAGENSPEESAGERLDTVEVQTGDDPRNAVIWLHGLGADGHDFEPVVPMLGAHRYGATRFVFPHADVRPVTINAGARMRAWYDIRGLQLSRDQDEAGIEKSAGQVRALIRREQRRGIPAERIVLAGFSQGGAIAAHVAIRFEERLAGLMALSTYLLFPGRLAAERNLANAGLPVFVGHGSMDPMVPVALGRDLADRLQALSHPLVWKQYPIPHSVSQQEIADIGNWLAERLS